jgi:hypothetical protein
VTSLWTILVKFGCATITVLVVGAGSAVNARNLTINSNSAIRVSPSSDQFHALPSTGTQDLGGGQQGLPGSMTNLGQGGGQAAPRRGGQPTGGGGDEWHWPDGSLKGGGQANPQGGGQQGLPGSMTNLGQGGGQAAPQRGSRRVRQEDLYYPGGWAKKPGQQAPYLWNQPVGAIKKKKCKRCR